jgi:hypothetical protein
VVVDVLGHRHGAMPQAPSHHQQGDAGAQAGRGVALTERVKGDGGQARSFRGRSERPRQVLRVVPRAILSGEDEPAIHRRSRAGATSRPPGENEPAVHTGGPT